MTTHEDMTVDTHEEINFDTQIAEDGMVTIHRMVWHTPISGRGREYRKMELVSSDDWVVGDAEAAFRLAKDILNTLIFYRLKDTE